MSKFRPKYDWQDRDCGLDRGLMVFLAGMRRFARAATTTTRHLGGVVSAMQAMYSPATAAGVDMDYQDAAAPSTNPAQALVAGFPDAL